VKVQKRSKFQIYFDILQLLDGETKSGNKPSLTKIAHGANLPYDRFRNCLEYLIQVGMISRKNGELVVTKKGLEYIEEFKKITAFFRRMGLLP